MDHGRGRAHGHQVVGGKGKKLLQLGVPGEPGSGAGHLCKPTQVGPQGLGFWILGFRVCLGSPARRQAPMQAHAGRSSGCSSRPMPHGCLCGVLEDAGNSSGVQRAAMHICYIKL